jgi:predicted metal-dependent phosphoesterase TrpH
MKGIIDLHVHSSYSDGIYKPAELVVKAASQGVRALAVADHDTVDGTDEAVEAGQAAGVEIIPAIELSVEYGKYHDVHLLGYFINHKDPELQDRLRVYRTKRDLRGEAIVARINQKLTGEKKGNISCEEVAALAKGVLGRPHIARVLVKYGFANDIQDAFTKYLIPCDVPKEYFAIADALETIQRLSGVAVLAHPTSISNDRHALIKLINELVLCGLDGIEAINNLATREDSLFLMNVAKERDLLITGGSDFHGIEEGVAIGKCSGKSTVPYKLIEPMQRLHSSRAARYFK